MATLKVKLRASVTEGKSGTIYYQIIHKRVVRQLKTDCKVYAGEWNGEQLVVDCTRAGARADKLLAIREQINGDLRRLRKIIRYLDSRETDYTADDVVDAFVNRAYEYSFFRFMTEVIEELRQLNRHRTAENYATTLNSFRRFRRGEDLSIGEISSELLMHYEASLSSCGVTKNTSSFYMRILRAVYNRGVEQNLTEQRNPFKHVYTGVDKTVKRAISFAALKRIKELDLSTEPSLDFARDMFMFSFYVRGMSFVDMAYLRRSDLRNGVLTYRRRKTGQQLVVHWERCMAEIVAKYERGVGERRTQSEGVWLLPIFTHGEVRYRSVLHSVNRLLKVVGRLAKIEIPLTMYVARHSWASVARAKKIPLSVISEGMGHDSETTTRIYLASLDAAVIDRANRVVLKGL